MSGSGGSGAGSSMFEEPDFSRAGSAGDSRESAPGSHGDEGLDGASASDEIDVTGDFADADDGAADDDHDDDDDDADDGHHDNDDDDDDAGNAGNGDSGDDDVDTPQEDADAENRLTGGAARAVLQHVARTLVDDPDSIEVEMTEGRSGLRFSVRVAQSDMGRLIGRRGRTAQALRTLVRAAAASEGTEASVDIVD